MSSTYIYDIISVSEVSDKLHDLTTLECHRQNTQKVCLHNVQEIKIHSSITMNISK